MPLTLAELRKEVLDKIGEAKPHGMLLTNERQKGRRAALQWVLRRIRQLEAEQKKPKEAKPEGWFPAMAFAVRK